MACVQYVVKLVGLFVENFDSIQLTLLMFRHIGITGSALSMKTEYDLGLHYVRFGVYRPAHCGIVHDKKTNTNFLVCFQLVFPSTTSKN